MKGSEMRTLTKLLAGPVLFLILAFVIDLDPTNPNVSRTAGIALWMAVWWIIEAVPLAVTALLPVVLFPTVGIMSGKTVAPIYFNHIIFLFIGGFLVALAMQRWNLHRRIALRILLWSGVHPQSILLGFMVTTAFLSMWISNTATTMMMVPIALAVTLRMEDLFGKENVARYSMGIFLGVAYSASIGGIATLVGTPPNLSFARILHILFPDAPQISFASWFVFGFPVSLVFLLSLWIFLSARYCPAKRQLRVDRGVFRKQYDELGPMSFEEKVVFADFVVLAVLWLSRADIQIGQVAVPGWSRIFPDPSFLNDGTVAIFMAVMLFVIPSRREAGQRVMDWETARGLPWNIVLLFGGGFALASGFKESGLALWLGQRFVGAESLPPVLIVVTVCFFVTFLTELTSNTATAEMLLPILGALGSAIQVNPLFLMIPATMSCSFAFMLPVATPPNAIVFGTGRLRISDMAKAGIWLNLFGILVTTAAVYLIGRAAFDIDLSRFPDWATMQ
jgi:sodium-dependent dicarboxylate transporter 2/3/5